MLCVCGGVHVHVHVHVRVGVGVGVRVGVGVGVGGCSGVGKQVRGKRVLIMDEVDDTRTTLKYAVEEVSVVPVPPLLCLPLCPQACACEARCWYRWSG